LHDASNTADSTSPGPSTNNTLWTVPSIGGRGYSSPAVANGRVFINGESSGIFHCLYERNGTEIWSATIGGAGQRSSTPAIYRGKVYIIGSMLYCFYENNGTEVWSQSLSGGGVGTSSPTVADGKVFVNTQNAYCFNAENGTELWSKPVGGSPYSSSPAYSNGKVFISGDKLFCFNAENGTEIWSSFVYGKGTSPSVVDGRVFINPSIIYCLNENNGTEIWRRSAAGDNYSSPALANGKVYVHLTQSVRCFYQSNGSTVWSVILENGDGCSTPAISSDNKLYVLAYRNGVRGMTYCLNASTGATIWNHITGDDAWSSPAISKGRVFVNEETIYCYGEPSPTVDFILIRDQPNGGGKNLCDPANYTSLPQGVTTTFYAAAYNFSAPGDGYIMDVPASFYWESDDTNIVNVTPTDSESEIETSSTNSGSAIITLSDIESHSVTTTVTVYEPTIDYILIRDEPDGNGNNLCNPANYPTYLTGTPTTFYGAMYNNSYGYLYDVPISSLWNSSDPALVSLSSPGSSTNVQCSPSLTGSATITLDIGGGEGNFTMVTVVEPQTDYVLIRDGPSGSGNNLCDPANFLSLPLGFATRFYGARYNNSFGYIGEVLPSANWTSEDPIIVNSSTPGIFSNISCSPTNNGTVTITLDVGGGLVNTTLVTVLSATVDYIQIRSAQGGGGNDLGDPANYLSFPVGHVTNFYAASYNGSNFISDVPVLWSSSNTTLVSVTPLGSVSQISCNIDTSGQVTITADFGGGLINTTQVTIIPPTIDYIQIRTESQGGGIDISNPLNYLSFPVGEGSTFHGARYNATAGYIDEVSSSSSWNSNDESIIDVSSPGISTDVLCSSVNFGTVTVTLNDGEGHTNFTQVTVIPPSVDYIKIRTEGQGFGIDICDPANYLSFPVGANSTLYGAEYNLTAGYIGEVDPSSTWISGEESIVTASSPGTSILIICNESNFGTVTVTLNNEQGKTNTTQVTVMEPTVDYIIIMNESGGMGIIYDSAHFRLGETESDVFYCAGYNESAGYMGDIKVNWSLSEDIGDIGPTIGNLTIFVAVEEGSAILVADYKGNTYFTQLTVEAEIDNHIMPSPTGLSVDHVEGGGELLLTWDPYTWTDIIGFRIYRSSDGGLNFSVLNPDDPVNGTSYHDSGLTNGVTYHYYITALDNALYESPSSEVKDNTPLGEEEPVDDGEQPDYTPWLLFPLLVIVLLIILFLVFYRRKKEKPQSRTFIETEYGQPEDEKIQEAEKKEEQSTHDPEDDSIAEEEDIPPSSAEETANPISED
jgi:outer membrane protein assembly factor BamB